MTALLNTEPVEVKGEKFASSLVVRDKKTGETRELPTSGIFVEIGALPNTDYAAEVVDRNEFGAVVVDPRTMRTSRAGIWSAGDCTDGLYHQNNIAAGDAVKALEDIYVWLTSKR
jgi:thioredoxin reductase